MVLLDPLHAVCDVFSLIGGPREHMITLLLLYRQLLATPVIGSKEEPLGRFSKWTCLPRSTS